MPAKWIECFEVKPGRWVFNPSEETRLRGQEIRTLVLGKWRPPQFFYHLQAGGHVAALRAHQHHTVFFKLDISDFFGTITRNRLSRALKPLAGGHAKSLELAKASVVQHPKEAGRTMLPYGFVQSPLLASLVLDQSRLGATLRAIQRRKERAVSVYVDDLLVSGDDQAGLAADMAAIKHAAGQAGFELREEKESGPGPSVTAFNVVMAAGQELAIADARFSQFAAILSAAPSAFEAAGIIGYVRSVNGKQADQLEELVPKKVG